MPLFTREATELTDRIARSNFTVYLHTAIPTLAAPTTGRVLVGGGIYESGATVAASDVDAAVAGEINFPDDIPFGNADEAAGTVTHYSVYRGADEVGFGNLAAAAIIGNGDNYKINGGTITITLS